MSSMIPGYPIPSQDPNRHDARPDPDEENPHELVLDASEIHDGLSPWPHPPAVPEDDEPPSTGT